MNTKENNFNVLRLLLATFVLFDHSALLTHWKFTPPINLGDFAVDAFFSISGFLITASWIRHRNPASFLARRVLRIYPAFLVCCGISGFVAAPALFGWKVYFDTLNLRRFVTYACLLQYRGPLARIAGGYAQFNVPVWTIHMEFCCYALLLGIATIGLLKHRWLILLAFIGSTICYAVPAWRDMFAAHLTQPYLLPLPVAFLRFLGFFLAGSVSFLYRDRIRLCARHALFAAGISAVALYPPSMLQPILPWTVTYVILWLAFARIRPLQWFRHQADISYGTYLYGWPIQFTLLFLRPEISFGAHFLLSCLGAYFCGFASWNLVEKWFLVPRVTRYWAKVGPVFVKIDDQSLSETQLHEPAQVDLDTLRPVPL